MRAVGITAPGGPEVLEVIDRPVRAAGPGEVRISVAAAAVNPTDIGLRIRGGGDELPPPWTPGMDAAGTVESVGPGVERIRVGEQVMAAVAARREEGGAQCELIVVPEQSVVPIPAGVSLAQASTLPMNGLTAMLALDLLGLRSGDTLAVSGGAGLLASYTIPLAKARGLRVLADAKPQDAALVAGFGADDVVPRGAGFTAAVRSLVPDGVDGLCDTALLRHDALPAIRDGGGIAAVRGWDDRDAERDIAVHEVWVRTVLDRTDWLDRLRAFAADGRIRLRLVGEYPPERAAEAQAIMGAGGLRGRVVIVF